MKKWHLNLVNWLCRNAKQVYFCQYETVYYLDIRNCDGIVIPQLDLLAGKLYRGDGQDAS